jgi:hypothetical protein
MISYKDGGLTSLNMEGVKRPIQAKQIEDIENINLNLGENDSIRNHWKKNKGRS